jgi:hypothetical protein
MDWSSFVTSLAATLVFAVLVAIHARAGDAFCATVSAIGAVCSLCIAIQAYA